MVWDVETWVGSPEDRTRAVKQFVRLGSPPTQTELASQRAQAVGLYRRTYQEWGMSQGQKVTERLVGAQPSSSTPPPDATPRASPPSSPST